MKYISTHTLTWSVTAAPLECRRNRAYFNSHAHVERDLKVVVDTLQGKDFNSHAHVERDICIYSDWIVKICISTHTLTWSVTQRSNGKTYAVCISTHTLTWSVTCTIFAFRTCFKNFNSHAHVERDIRKKYPMQPFTNFNSHAHVERDKSRRLWWTN